MTISSSKLFAVDVITPYASHKRTGRIRATQSPVSCDHLMASTNVRPRCLIDVYTTKLIEFTKNDTIPPYAVLSHRWKLGEEVMYEELLYPRDETKAKLGYRKIMAACQKARDGGVHYIWVDTCCIKQGDDADIKANITSMYAYYQNAAVCYAYLADLPQARKSLDSSEWFTRGWTLQELLAPPTVIFFDKNWSRIGSRHELRYVIYIATTIPVNVLSSEKPVRDVSVVDRMTWALGRETTKPQDRAYCLQGLLGITVEPNYDEWYWTSFNRLGKALLAAYPELKQILQIDEYWFDRDGPETTGLCHLLWDKRNNGQAWDNVC
ncbi:hypothetical protein VKT23_015713 [Stygiomarasmius scandens]|uniref:Heterokaryon incompatibility domain-containing protein n=1 Tax=Marasmiellus scandens TaxID=2682957 RepID=A0ABR1J097_9AGAR